MDRGLGLLHGFLVHMNSFELERLVYTRRSVCAVRLFKDLPDLFYPRLLTLFAFAGYPFEPLVESRAANIKQVAQPFFTVAFRMRFDEGVLYGRVFAKYAAAFLRISMPSLACFNSF